MEHGFLPRSPGLLAHERTRTRRLPMVATPDGDPGFPHHLDAGRHLSDGNLPAGGRRGKLRDGSLRSLGPLRAAGCGGPRRGIRRAGAPRGGRADPERDIRRAVARRAEVELRRAEPLPAAALYAACGTGLGDHSLPRRLPPHRDPGERPHDRRTEATPSVRQRRTHQVERREYPRAQPVNRALRPGIGFAA